MSSTLSMLEGMVVFLILWYTSVSEVLPARLANINTLMLTKTQCSPFVYEMGTTNLRLRVILAQHITSAGMREKPQRFSEHTRLTEAR